MKVKMMPDLTRCAQSKCSLGFIIGQNKLLSHLVAVKYFMFVAVDGSIYTGQRVQIDEHFPMPISDY